MSFAHDGYGVSQETFQKIVLERKEERKQVAQVKRCSDAKRIQEMKSRSGVTPLAHFPKEIWVAILEEITPEDKAKMREIHPVFKDLLEGNLIQNIVFPQVLEHLTPVLCESKYWNPAQFIELRKVGKSLREGINLWFEKKFCKQMRQGVLCYSDEISNLVLTKELSLDRWRKNRERFGAAFGSTSDEAMKQFFTRSLQITIPDPFVEDNEDGLNVAERFRQFKTDILSLLNLVGGQIWGLVFDLKLGYMEDEGISLCELYVTIKEWLLLMPNVKWIHFLFDYSTSDDVPVCDMQNNENETALKSVLRSYPMPTLPFLERLDFDDCCGGDMESEYLINRSFDFFEAVLVSNQHVKILGIGGPRFPSRETSLYNLIQCIPLEGISINEAGCLDLENSSHFLQQYALNAYWSLKQITMGIKEGSMHSVFGVLGNFKTLESVALIFHEDFFINCGDDIDFLELPNLMDFRIQFIRGFRFKGNCHFFFSLQFLLYCKKLKHLSWKIESWKQWSPKDGKHVLMDSSESLHAVEVHMDKYHDPEKMIEFGGSWNWRDLNDSNIWNVFPALEKVRIKEKDRNVVFRKSRP